MPGPRAYLIQMTNAFTLTVTGRPVWRPRVWAPDAYSLRGFPIDPVAPPTFGDFFRPSPAHFDAATGRLQKIYRLAPTGHWKLAAPPDGIAAGEGYWVFTKGGSDYSAPLQVSPDNGDGLDFGSQLKSRTLTFRNQRNEPITVSIRDRSIPSDLSYAQFSPT